MNINNYLQPGKSINVTASAGTGKTWVIISKILRLLLEGEKPEKITAITFTKKASAEMRDRLNEKIELWANLDDEKIKEEIIEIGLKDNLNAYIKKAKKLFIEMQLNTKDIRISTFDSFFMELLSQFHLDKDVSKNYETNTSINSKLIAEDTEKKIFSEIYLKNNTYLQANIDFLIKYLGSFHTVKESISGIINKKSYYLEIQELLDVCENYDKEKNNRIDKYQKDYFKSIINIINTNNLRNNFKELIDIIDNEDYSNDNKIDDIQKYFLTKDRKQRKSIEKKLKLSNLDNNAFINEIFIYEEKIFYEIQKSWKILIKYFFNEYQNYLNIYNLYDFSDKTWLCYKKLSYLDKDDWMFYKIANSINHILIDEFQDTNYIQWKIIEMVLDSIKNLSITCSVTIVGDEKQSIYGFRGSEPKLFKLCKKYTNDIFNSENMYLNESKRSSNEIINYVNSIFPDQKNFFTKIKDVGSVNINNINENIKTSEITNHDQIILESDLISKQIKNLIDTKKIKYKDILILVRNRTHINELRESLISNNIPVLTDNKNSLLDNNEIRDLYNLLKFLILKNKNNYELFSLLISPIFNYKIKELKYNDFLYLEKLMYKSKNGKYLKEWEKLVGKVPIHDLLDKIYGDLNIIEIYMNDNDLKNSETKNNFLNFLNLSLKINNGRYISPFNFLYQIERIKKFQESSEMESLNSVKILTIHGAKGLESNVIILAQTYRRIEIHKDMIYPIISDNLSCKDILYRTNIYKNNSFIENLFLESKEKEASEENNLLYVACTRAKKILIINGYADSKNNWFSNHLFFQ